MATVIPKAWLLALLDSIAVSELRAEKARAPKRKMSKAKRKSKEVINVTLLQ